ncbi:VacJ family lipoprotein, partial [Tardiphaga sp.]|uniref:MlaA family lipoprotein n=1 Tax=Tardiphaga sp. TaxID=1926292 RepID=UPI00352A1965
MLLAEPMAAQADLPLEQVADEAPPATVPTVSVPPTPVLLHLPEVEDPNSVVLLQATAAGPLADVDTAARTEQDDIVVTAREGHAPGDPLQGVNVQTFAVTQAVDKAVVEPVALTYQRALPAPLRSAIRNFFNNLSEPVSFLNFFLQLKPGKAAETAGRFAVNTTIGVAGMIDIAKRKPFRLPRRPNGFANTLGYYGVKPGPFLFLPLIGPTTVRDLIGLSIDRMVLPSAIGQPFNQPTYSVPATIVGSVDYRVEFDEQLRKLREAPDENTGNKRGHGSAGSTG